MGGIQIFDNTIGSINLALLEVQTRLDELKGLHGRSLIYDRVRANDPTEANDAVTLGSLQEGAAVVTYPFYMAPSTPLGVFAPGTTYVERSSALRQQVNFASPQGLEGRVMVEGWGTGSGSNKGVAITTSSGVVICEVLWSGSTEGLKVGSFTPITLAVDQAVQLRCKGSSATEALVLASVVFDLRYAVIVAPL